MPKEQKHGRFRKVFTRVHNDEQYRALSPIRPSGQSLWLYLLTAKESFAIPGLIPLDLPGLASSLRWPPAATKKHWLEIEAQGMGRADWQAPLIWLPRAIKYNEPESPNVIRSWGKVLHELPECGLRAEALSQIARHVEGMGEGFVKAFGEAFEEALPKVYPKGSPNQDQEQEVQPGTGTGSSPKPPSPPAAADDPPVVQAILQAYRKTPGTPAKTSPGDRRAAYGLAMSGVAFEIVEIAFLLGASRRAMKPGPDPIRSLSYFLPIVEELKAAPPTPGYAEYLRGQLQQVEAGPTAASAASA